MSAIPVKDVLLSEEEYLEGEAASLEKHEFVAGVAHAMAGAGYGHNTIMGNIYGALHGRLRGHRCQPFNSEMKVRVQTDDRVHFYYPDGMVACDGISIPMEQHWIDSPAVIFEVLSESTRRIDEGEKALLYWKVPSLTAYLLVEQDKVQVTVRRRDGGGEVLRGRDTLLRLPELGLEIPLGEFYERLAL